MRFLDIILKSNITKSKYDSKRVKMAKNKARDDKFFNCNQEKDYDEKDYVARQYPEHYEEVYEFLKRKCKNKQIHYSTHAEVYQHN